MNRREFLQTVGLGAIRLTAGGIAVAACGSGCGGGGGTVNPGPGPGPNPSPVPNPTDPTLKSLNDWIPGIIHCHSTFSDGSQTIAELCAKAKLLGMHFLAITDHYEQIITSEKLPAKYGFLTGKKPCVGWTNYSSAICAEADFNRTSAESGFAPMYGFEVETWWQPEPNTKDHSHVLALGSAEGNVWYIDLRERHYGTQAEVVARLKARGCYPIAAHPELIKGPYAWEQLRYRFDHRFAEAYESICGVEFWNSSEPEQDQSTLDWYLSMMAQHRPVFVTSGCDYHGYLIDEDTWEHVTWLLPTPPHDGAKMPELQGLVDCHSYAANRGAKIDAASFMPGSYIPQPASRPVHIAFVCDNTGGETGYLYRDGQLVATGEASNFAWDDSSARGVCWYNFWVPGRLITAPIVISA